MTEETKSNGNVSKKPRRSFGKSFRNTKKTNAAKETKATNNKETNTLET